MAGRKPNILFIMTDSLAPQFTAPWGGPKGSMPNVERLARQGVLFENAYCNSPLCTPSRASLVTGRYVADLGCFDNSNEFSSEWPSMAHALRGADYETTLVGKMHFDGYDQWHGFEKRFAHETDYTTGYSPKHYRMAYEWDQPSAGNPMGGDWMAPSYVQSPDWDHFPFHYNHDEKIHREALEFLGGKTAESNPFFCCVSYHAPHNPFWIPERWREAARKLNIQLPSIPEGVRPIQGIMDQWLYDFHYTPEVRDRLMDEDNLRWLYETFYGILLDVDHRIGELLELLKRQGLDENTAIVFASDHGDMMARRGFVQKRCFYEHSVRVPMIFSFPGQWPEGARLQTPVSLVDLFPTFTDLAGGTPPAGLPGMSLMPSVVNAQEPPGRTIFCEYHGEGVHAPCFMARRGQFKYIYVHGHEERLYDLANDPEEYENVIADPKFASVAAAMKEALLNEFDPDAVARTALRSQKNRQYIMRNVCKE